VKEGGRGSASEKEVRRRSRGGIACLSVRWEWWGGTGCTACRNCKRWVSRVALGLQRKHPWGELDSSPEITFYLRPAELWHHDLSCSINRKVNLCVCLFTSMSSSSSCFWCMSFSDVHWKHKKTHVVDSWVEKEINHNRGMLYKMYCSKKSRSSKQTLRKYHSQRRYDQCNLMS
jgi:hypothetical protein